METRLEEVGFVEASLTLLLHPQALIQEMVNQLGAMERVVRTRAFLEKASLSKNRALTPFSILFVASSFSSASRLHGSFEAMCSAIPLQFASRSR